MKRAAFYSLDCKVNQYESEALAELFRAAGYEIVDFDSQAECYIINTCSVTSMSDRKSRQIIRRAKKNNPGAVVIVTGCYAQTAPDEVKKIDGVNLVVGTDNKTSIVSLAESITPSSCRVIVNDISHGCDFEEMNVSDYTGRTRAFIKIQDGCNQFCSYCIIPYARGRIRSRSRDAALNEARILAANGYKEIILTGIHIASYGAENDDGYESVSDAATTVDTEERTAKVGEIQKKMFENWNIIPFYSDVNYIAYKDYVKGVTVHSDGALYWNDISF